MTKMNITKELKPQVIESISFESQAQIFPFIPAHGRYAIVPLICGLPGTLIK